MHYIFVVGAIFGADATFVAGPIFILSPCQNGLIPWTIQSVHEWLD